MDKKWMIAIGVVVLAVVVYFVACGCCSVSWYVKKLLLIALLIVGCDNSTLILMENKTATH